MSQPLRALVLVLVSCACLATAFAQTPGGDRENSRDGGDRRRPAMQAPRTAGAAGETVELIEFRLNLLEENLALRPDQLGRWDRFAGRVRAVAADILRERSPLPSTAPLGAARQMDREIDRLRDRLTALEDVGDALRMLYATLNAEQRLRFDERMPTILPLLVGESRAPATAGAAARGAPPGPPADDAARQPPRDKPRN